ncbi:hypothetical protein ACFLU5_09340 [Bacteroidota bacterium]
MKKLILFFSLLFLSIIARSQDRMSDVNTDTNSRILIGCNLGVNCSYSDEAYNFSAPVASISFDYHIKNGYYLQVAPKYSWLYKWNEHYLTVPLHVRKRFSNRFSFYAGPSITWDVGYFRDLGISAGTYFHVNEQSSIILSVYTFTLYDYEIDYLYAPVGISYNHYLYNK